MLIKRLLIYLDKNRLYANIYCKIVKIIINKELKYMKLFIANVLSRASMKEARSLVYKFSREIRNDRTRTVRVIFQNSYVNINHSLALLKISDKISTNLSRKDVDLILETAKAELKKYQRLGKYYVKWEWNWNTEHTIIILLLAEILLTFFKKV